MRILSRIKNRLETLQSRVAGYREQLAALQIILIEFKASTGRLLTYMALLVTLILLWLVLSQAALLVLSWRFYSGKDLLAMSHRSRFLIQTRRAIFKKPMLENEDISTSIKESLELVRSRASL